MSKPHNTIRTFALICVAVTTAYVMFMGWWINTTLSGPGWCRTALGAEKASAAEGTIKGLEACVDLLKIQLKSLAVNSHVLFGVIALCLAVLIVIVIAGGRVSFKASRDGVETDISRDPGKAADEVAGAAVERADQINEEVKL
jgi:hypothetical protein